MSSESSHLCRIAFTRPILLISFVVGFTLTLAPQVCRGQIAFTIQQFDFGAMFGSRTVGTHIRGLCGDREPPFKNVGNPIFLVDLNEEGVTVMARRLPVSGTPMWIVGGSVLDVDSYALVGSAIEQGGNKTEHDPQIQLQKYTNEGSLLWNCPIATRKEKFLTADVLPLSDGSTVVALKGTADDGVLTVTCVGPQGQLAWKWRTTEARGVAEVFLAELGSESEFGVCIQVATVTRPFEYQSRPTVARINWLGPSGEPLRKQVKASIESSWIDVIVASDDGTYAFVTRLGSYFYSEGYTVMRLSEKSFIEVSSFPAVNSGYARENYGCSCTPSPDLSGIYCLSHFGWSGQPAPSQGAYPRNCGGRVLRFVSLQSGAIQWEEVLPFPFSLCTSLSGIRESPDGMGIIGIGSDRSSKSNVSVTLRRSQQLAINREYAKRFVDIVEEELSSGHPELWRQEFIEAAGIVAVGTGEYDLTNYAVIPIFLSRGEYERALGMIGQVKGTEIATQRKEWLKVFKALCLQRSLGR